MPGTISSITSRSAGSSRSSAPTCCACRRTSGLRPLYDWLAEKLAAKLSVDPSVLPQPLTLNDVVCAYLGQRGRREEAYTRLRSIMREVEFEPPLALRQLAQITDFDLFVTTTFDPLLEKAVNLERYGGQPTADVIAYAPNRVADLPTERSQLQRAVVYHLLGRLSASPTYVVSDEDMLEFICALQSEHLTPEKLFHELEHNHLLLIGSDFSNWLARLFLRMAKRKRLSDPRDVGEVLADDHTHEGRTARRVPAAGQRAHARLRRRRSVRRRTACPLDEAPGRRRRAGRLGRRRRSVSCRPSREMPEHAIFISYAREDLPAVQRLKAAMDAAGLTTWFDLDRLEGGDDYDRKIRANIARCSLLRAGHLGDDAATARGLFPPRVELCGGSLAQHRRRRRVHPAGLHRRHARGGCTGARQVPGAAHHAHAGRRADAGFPAATQGSLQRASRMSAPPDELASSIAIDPENPWLGLSSYTEETRAYFHGRDEEAAELARRVQRKNLTVLFGQSGLGKTSLLRAGLVPRLRGEGFCPVYVRVD